jgi:plasmid stabilization system protein ParE
MAQLKIVWTVTAVNQRNSIFKYWNERNKSTSYSKKLALKIKERLILLQQNPNMGKPTTFRDTRAISMEHYSIIYQCNETHIIVSAFWDNRQDPKKLIEILKENL